MEHKVMKKVLNLVVNFIMRAVLGCGVIYLINTIIGSFGIGLAVGMNEVTVITAGLLGVPGVGLLYAIAFLC